MSLPTLMAEATTLIDALPALTSKSARSAQLPSSGSEPVKGVGVAPALWLYKRFSRRSTAPLRASMKCT